MAKVEAEEMESLPSGPLSGRGGMIMDADEQW